MIPKQKIDEVFDAARIEEVIGDFVTLKKKGADYKACCPFHNEKTPSFSVSTSKGIYKCFGCGEGGNVVDFVMSHEQYTFIEAIKWLANKYGIVIEEKKQTEEEKLAADERESLLIVTSFAQKVFENALFNTDEGKSVGLAYLRKRGFTDSVIKKFNLGYSPDKWDYLTTEATKKGYKLEFLKTAGLSKDKNGSFYDGFRGRVMFPIHSVSGKPIGFGGRVLSDVKKQPKYINSPESVIYVKNKVLYGIFQAKKAISKLDNCFLVEGYTDVVSLFQNGIENVVASSGTSLTTGQIRLIKRYTPNITILYDGDIAGAKASFRGIDMVLEEGMNVKVVQFPEGEDPDSMANKLGAEKLTTYVNDNAQDFIRFKTTVLKDEIGNDPIKKSKLIHEIISSIALIPDQVVRSLFVKECSDILEIDEQILLSELNKTRRKKVVSSNNQPLPPEFGYNDIPPIGLEQSSSDYPHPTQKEEIKVAERPFEKDILRLVLNYGNEILDFEEDSTSVKDFIITELEQDELSFSTDSYIKFWDKIKTVEGKINLDHFFQSEDEDIRKLAVELTSHPYILSDWESRSIIVNTELMLLKRAVTESVYAFKCNKIEIMINSEEENLKKSLSESDLIISLQNLIMLKELRRKLKIEIGRPI